MSDWSNYRNSADPFHARALRAYIERFNFVGIPLDVALRKLLMDVGLPRETQQIDRVMEAFAARYVQCNPNLFSSDGERPDFRLNVASCMLMHARRRPSLYFSV